MRGCAASRRYIDVCYCDMLSVVNVYFDYLKLCGVCINGPRYVCCGKCFVVSECGEPTSCLVQHIGAHCCEVMYFGCFDFRGELGFLNCDYICMCVVNMLVWCLGEVAVSAYMGGTRGSGVLSSVDDVLDLILSVCDMCMCLARGWGW